VTGSGPAAISLRGVGVWRARPGGSRAHLLRDVDWTVSAGERWAVLGPNGAGKSTLLQVAGARAFPSSGSATILGDRLGQVDVRGLRARVGHVDAATAVALRGSLSAREVVLTGVENTLLPRPGAVTGAHLRAARELMDLLGVAGQAARPFSELSRGERQRVLVARALVTDPPLLLLDEPTEGLDLPGRELFIRALERLSAARPGLASVQVAHHLEDLAPGTGHVLMLREGRVAAEGPAADVLRPEILERCFGVPVRVVRAEGRLMAMAPADSSGPSAS
jgi:iron complex transport system ATP-binding protein